MVENDRCSKSIVQLFKFITRLIHWLKLAIHCFTGVVFKRDIQIDHQIKAFVDIAAN